MPRYRLNVDFDNSIEEFLYNGTGSYTFTVPATPNFDSTRYVVYLPAVLYLKDASKLPAITSYTRVEGRVPSTAEFRTIAAAQWDSLLLKDAIEFPAASAGATLTMTNYYTVGSTVDPADFMDLTNAQTKNGIVTFGSIPVGPASNPTTDNQLTRKKYVDDSVVSNITYVNSGRTCIGVKVTSDQNINTGVRTLINFESEQVDNLNEYDTSAKRFTAVNSGNYLISVNLGVYLGTSSAFAGDLEIVKNGTVIVKSKCISDAYFEDLQCIAVIPLTADQYIDIYFNNLSSYTLTMVATDSYLSIVRV